MEFLLPASTPFLLLSILFVVLAVDMAQRGRREGQQAVRQLAPFLGAVGLLAAVVPLLVGDQFVLALLALFAGLSVYPLLLLEFGALLSSMPDQVRAASRSGLAGALALALLAAVLLPGEAAVFGAVLVLGTTGLGVHVLIGRALRRQSRTIQSSFLQRRAVALRVGLGFLAVALGVSVYGVRLTAVAPAVSVAAGLVAAALLVAAAAPPQWLQLAFMAPDLETLELAEDELLRSEDLTEGCDVFLTALARLFGGTASWLERDGVVVAGTRPAGEWTATGDGEGVSCIPMVDAPGSWLLHAPIASGAVCVVVTGDPMVFGLDGGVLVPRLARRFERVLQARRSEERRHDLRRSRQEAEHYRRMSDLKEDLLATINHELRTPLTTVGGSLKLLDARWDELDVDQRRTLVARTHANAQSLQQVVFDVLTLVSLRSGSTEPNIVPVLLHEVVDHLPPKLRGDARVTVSCGDAVADLDVDLAGCVLTQLVENAVDHTDGLVDVQLSIEGDRLVIVVRDRGPGVPAALLGAFDRGGHYLRRTTRGLGLGLSLVQETTDLLGGALTFTIDVDGMSARCELPIGAADAPQVVLLPAG